MKLFQCQNHLICKNSQVFEVFRTFSKKMSFLELLENDRFFFSIKIHVLLMNLYETVIHELILHGVLILFHCSLRFVSIDLTE